MKSIISVGIGGVLGALVRYYITVPLNSHDWFPVGTLIVNLVGSIFLAFFLTVILEYFQSSSYLVLAVSTGFTGSFTTFSSLSVEVVKIAEASPLNALLYIGVSFIFGFLLSFAGRFVGKVFLTNMKSEETKLERIAEDE
ncbi:fluoride efflux transporter FluC [Desulfolucanica intricata]|uniref:fluoride efflux transporter FluC n=1 Tax=Desulfolucanica intricata TaxID=1285191 RepID=UPI0008333B13|nr:CrcB family protein [Desulfolucanica intricata]